MSRKALPVRPAAGVNARRGPAEPNIDQSSGSEEASGRGANGGSVAPGRPTWEVDAPATGLCLCLPLPAGKRCAA